MQSGSGKRVLVMGMAALVAGGAAVAHAQSLRREAGAAYAVGEPGGWFGVGDYPAAALAAGEQGRTVIEIAVGSNGAVRSCKVVASSGSASLDARTCELALARGRFAPVAETAGTTTVRLYRLPVQWTMPEIEVAG